jgi:hypothetical protein
MYEIAFARPPGAAELERAVAFVHGAGSTDKSWRDLAHALFQMKEFIYLR